MPTTTIHIGDDLLARIDEVVKKKGISRNKYIIQACERSLKEDGAEWPEDFFDHGLDNDQLQLLREAVTEMEQEILSRRKNRRTTDI